VGQHKKQRRNLLQKKTAKRAAEIEFDGEEEEEEDDDDSDSESDAEGGGDGGGGSAEPTTESESEPNHLDPSQLSFSFDSAPLMVDPHRSSSGGCVWAVLTVRLAAGAFSVGQRRDKKLAASKQRDMRWSKRHQPALHTTSDEWHDRRRNPVVELLGLAFPERWGVDEESPLVRMRLTRRDFF